MSTTVGELNVKMNLELQKLEAQVSQANAKIKKMSGGFHSDISKAAKGINNAFATIGVGLSVGAVIGFGKSVIDLGGNIMDLSAEANMTPQAFQAISVSAMDAGVSMEDVAKSSEHMRSQLQDASTNGAAPLNASLANFNLTAAGLKSLRPEDQWAVLGDKLAHASDKQAAMNLVSDLFGSNIGPKLRTTLLEVANGIDSINTQGLTISDDQLQKLDAAGDKLEKFGLRLKVIFVEALDFWGPVLEKFGIVIDKFVNKNFDLKKGSFADELFRDKQQDMSRGANILPGGVASKTPVLTPAQQLEDKMDAAAKDARAAALAADPFLKMKEAKAKKDKIGKDLHLFFDDIDQISKDNPIDPIKMKKEDLGVNMAPTDAFARMGLMTGTGANPEVRKQTTLLKSIHQVLEKINTGVRNADAGFAN